MKYDALKKKAKNFAVFLAAGLLFLGTAVPARGQWYQIMLQNGPFSVNDVRALEDLPDIPGGDEHRASLNDVPLSLWAELSRLRAESRAPAE